MRRRKYLCAVSSALGVAVAGCTVFTDGHETVQDLSVSNPTEEEAIIDLEIETQAGEHVFERTYEIQPRDSIPVECVWPDKPLVIRASQRGSDSWGKHETRDEDICTQIDLQAVNGEVAGFESVRECPHEFAARCHKNDENDK